MRLLPLELGTNLIQQRIRHAIGQVNDRLARHQHQSIFVDLNNRSELGGLNLVDVAVIDQEFD